MSAAGPNLAVASARELHARAVDAYGGGRPAEARRLATRALRSLDDAGDAGDEVRTRLLITLALSTAELDGAAAGRTVLDDAERRADDAADPGLRVLVGAQRLALAIRTGDASGAVREWGRTRPLIEHAGPVDRLMILANAALAHQMTGDVRTARRLFVQAGEQAAAARRLRHQAMIEHNIGYIDFLVGDLPSALRQMAIADELGSDKGEGIALLDRARVLFEAGLLLDAETCLAQAGALFEHDRLGQDLGETEIERSRVALAGGDVAGARRMAARARDRFRRRGNAQWRRSAELALLQAELAAHRPAGRLVESALGLRDEFAAEGMRQPARTAGLIATEATAHHDAVAAADLLAGLGAPRRTDPITARLHYDHVRALVDSRRGRHAAATRRVHRALNDLADYQASFGSIDMRTAAAIHGRLLAVLDIALARRTGRVDSVFAAAERARAATSRLPTVRPPADPGAADLLAELRQTIESLRAVEFDRTAAAPLLRRRRELEKEILARTWTHSGGGSAVRVATLSDVRVALDRLGPTMVMYVQAGAELSAVVVGERSRLVELGPAAPVIEAVRRARADLDVLASPQLPGPIRGAVRSSLGRSLAELDAALLQPLAGLDGPLVVVSTGVLGQLPWASLPSLRAVPVVVAPSATKWLASVGGRQRRTRTLTLAGPDLGRGVDEATKVAAAWSDATAVPAAERADLTAGLRRADLLHVAAHGVHQSENPLFSSLRLTDGPVFAHELAGRAPAHVVLSACEVGLATIRPGDEALGLASVLQQLGTRSVVASVARVNDDQAARVMIDYHHRLAGGTDSATALAQALQTGDDDLVAPFVCFGSAWRASGFGARRGARVT